MAITIVTQPRTGSNYTDTSVQSAYSPNVIVATSDNVLVRMRLKLTLNSVLVAEIDHDLDLGTTNQCTFDISSIIQDNLKYFLPNLTPASGASQDATTVYRRVTALLVEVVLVNGLLIVNPDLSGTSINEYIAYMTIKQNEETDDIISYNYNNGGVTGKKFLTDAPLEKSIPLNSHEFLAFILNKPPVVGDELIVNQKVYLKTGSFGNFTTILVAGSLTARANFISIGTKNNIENTLPAFDTIDKYEVFLSYKVPPGQAVQITEKRTFYVEEETCEDVRLHFINQRVGMDSLTFSNEQVERLGRVESGQYEKVKSFPKQVKDRGLVDFSVTGFDRLVINTGLQNRDYLRWLKQLILSSEVYLEEKDTYIPVVVLNKDSYDLRSDDPNGLQFDLMKANRIKGFK